MPNAPSGVHNGDGANFWKGQSISSKRKPTTNAPVDTVKLKMDIGRAKAAMELARAEEDSITNSTPDDTKMRSKKGRELINAMNKTGRAEEKVGSLSYKLSKARGNK